MLATECSVIRKPYPVRPLAKMLGVSANSLYAAIKRKEIEAIQIGRRILVPAAVVERLLYEGKVV